LRSCLWSPCSGNSFLPGASFPKTWVSSSFKQIACLTYSKLSPTVGIAALPYATVFRASRRLSYTSIQSSLGNSLFKSIPISVPYRALTFSAAPIFSNNSSTPAKEAKNVVYGLSGPHFRKHRYSHRVSGCRLLHLRSSATFLIDAPPAPVQPAPCRCDKLYSCDRRPTLL
jgi:hypothetical protein